MALNNIYMKKIITLLFLSATINAYSQSNPITQAIITTKTTVVAPEEDETAPTAAPTSGPGGDEIRIMRFMGDGETKSTTWLKNDMIKTFSETETGRTSIIRDNSKKITTTVMEMMGKKFGFSATDEDQAAMRKRMDSMMQSRNQSQTTTPSAPKIDIIYTTETKKLVGYECKKALIVSTRSNGKADTTLVWYAPDLKIQGVTSTGGAMGGFGGFNPQGSNGMELLKGFPMQYERNMNRGRKMTVVVTKIVTDKEVADKEFEIPKDVEIRSAKDMQNGPGPGGFQMRIGG